MVKKKAVFILLPLLSACDVTPESRAQYEQRSQATYVIAKTTDLVKVTRIGVVNDDLAYDGKRGVYEITDTRTGQTFIGVSGIGIAEVGSHMAGKSSIRDER